MKDKLFLLATAILIVGSFVYMFVTEGNARWKSGHL